MGNEASESTTQAVRFQVGRKGKPDEAWMPVGEPADLGRVTVVLGANGTGKSRLLQRLASQPVVDGAQRPLVYIEGGRALTLPEITKVSHGHDDQQFHRNYRKRHRLTQRLDEMLKGIAATRQLRLQSDVGKMYAWQSAGQTLELMPRFDVNDGLTALLKSFVEIFPDIKIDLEPSGKWSCLKGGHTYGLNKLSDGEKQVFCILGDLLVLAPPNSLVVIDEPELNLHPALAVRLWDLIEDKLPSAVFVYATHSLSFAMRRNVEDVLILAGDNQAPTHLKGPGIQFPCEQMLPFLGALPGIITSQRTLIAEGDDNSFDRPFYNWINADTASIANVGSCHNVRAAVKRSGVWSTLGNVVIAGILDRDYRTDEQIQRLRDDGCAVLDYHEAESYLCHPSILHLASTRSGRRKSEAEIIAYLCQQCGEKLRVRVAVNRTIAKSEIRLAVSPDESGGMPDTNDAATEAIEKWVRIEMDRASSLQKLVTEGYKQEYAVCSNAVAQKDTEKILALFPGKAIIRQMASFVGFNKPAALLASLAELEARTFPPLVKIFNSLWTRAR